MMMLSTAVYGFVLFSASSWDGVDGSRIRGANQQGDRDLEAFSDQVGNVYCGNWNRCGGVNVGLSDLDDDQAVRCCSSDASLLWDFKCNSNSGIADVFGASPGCKRLPYLDAKAYCESFSGGRLCTYDEIKAKCTRSTGCGFDRELVWGESLPTCITNSESCITQEPGACCSGFCDTTSLQCIDAPTSSPSATPTTSPSASPTPNPTDSPSVPPTPAPSTSPTRKPTSSPSTSPTNSPSTSPTSSPSSSPSVDLPDEGDLLHTVWTAGKPVQSFGCLSDSKSWRARDGTTYKYSCTRDVNALQGIIITPNNGGRKSIVTAMRLYPGNHNPNQTPLSYILSGRADAESPWVYMFDGEFPGVRAGLPNNVEGLVINSTYKSGDTNFAYSEVGLPNNGDAYLDYKIEFTAMMGGSSTTYLRFAELELPGHLEASVSPTLSPSTTPTSEPTDSPSTSPTPSPSASPSSEPSNSPSTTPTKSPSTSPTSSPTDSPSVDLPDEGDLLHTVWKTGEPVQSFGCLSDSKSWRARDGTTYKYSCTRDVNVTQGFIITPNNGGRKSIVTAMRLYPGSHNLNQTPLSYILSGRADAESPWVYMFDGEFPGVRAGLPKNVEGLVINSTFKSGDTNFAYSEVGLPNNGDAYLDYKIEFTAMRGGSSTTYLRFAELELPGHLEASLSPTLSPSISPTKNPTDSPTVTPTAGPSRSPSTTPTFNPTSSPTHPILECPSYLAGRLPLCAISKDSSCEFGLLRYEVLEESSPGAANGILCARVEIPNHDGWVGIGFSDNGSMTGGSIATTAVVGVPGSGTVMKYSLTARNKSGVYQMENQTLRGTSIFVNDDDTTIMTFVKLLSESDEVEILASGLNHFIAAKGGEFFLGDYHTPHYSNRQPNIEKDFSEDVPTASPSFAPTISPTTAEPSTSPTFAPSSSPTEPQPSSTPTSSPSATPTSKPTFQPTVTGYARPCPPAGDDPIGLTPGSQRFELSLADSACGIFIRKSTGALVPYARSYGGGVWEASPGPMAASMDSIDCTSSCMVELAPLDDLDDEYIIVAKAARPTTNRDQIARWLEMTSFGPRMDEINALDDGVWSVEDRVAHLRQQIGLPMTSHREYFRERANAIWDDTSIPAKSDHPCSPGSKWRRYTYVYQDREYTRTDELIYTTFETVETEKDLEYFIFESDSFDEVNVGNGERGFNFRDRAHHSGLGYYDMHEQGDFVEWNIAMPEAGTYPISFRYANGGRNGDGNTPLQLSVNGEVIASAYPFIYTDSWSFYKYSDMIDATLNAGSNTIRIEITEDHFGPNIDHLRVGKPPAVVMKTNGWARTVLRNGISLLNGWPMVWDETTEVSFRNYPEPPQGDLWLFGANYGNLKLRFPTGAEKFLEAGNPPVDFTGYEQYLPENYFTFDHSDVWFNTTSDMWDGIPLLEGQEMLLVNGIDSAVCDFIPAFAEEASLDAPIFGRLPDDSWVQWTPTIQLEPNGPAHNAPPSQRSSSTIADGGGSTVISTNERTKCANVPRSPFNDDTCILSTESTACSPFEVMGEVPLDLNATNIEAIYDLTGRLVYAIRGLGLDLVEQHACGSKTRWEYEHGTCDSTTSLGNNTRKAIVSALSSGTVPPDHFKDIRVSASDCDASDVTLENLGIKIQVGGYCAKQVHPDDWNVYDFTVWASRHPGGSYNIQKWATDTFQSMYRTNGWQLDYPFKASPDRPLIQEHPMNRWETNGKRPNVEFIGTFGSTVAYRDLPNDLKLQEVSDYFGATSEPVTSGGVVVCGSAGEVSNDPFKRQVFDYDSNEERTTRDDVMANQKHVVWSEIALNGEDQLRQRMAWALCQIVTTVPSNINARFQTEIYTEYYDICVKHAFGNYGNLLKEASYSPLMAEHLSYLKSKSHEYVYRTENRRITRADENFAREVMQLFTIGLFALNDDGTPVLDIETNKPLETYTNEDIESFARAWTGFTRVGVRGNYEAVSGGSEDNRLDPMRIIPYWRDAFPKPDLNGGFIGDRYALCVDLPDRSFLKAGAKYRLLGGSPLPQLTSDPSQFAQDSKYPYLLHLELDSSNSDLYKALDADAEGRHAMTVTLESDIECFGVECKLDTIRTVKIGSIYYEFVEKPCVQLSFFEGKQISRRENKLFGAMCANPNLPQASEACCREERLQEVRSADKVPGVTFFYEAERMKFDTAHDRCVDYGKDLCFFENTKIQDTPNDGFRKGYSWTNLDCSVNVKINKEGYIAIVHDPELSYKYRVDSQGTPSHLEENDTQNWFRVQWEGSFPGSSESNTCASFGCKTLASGDCLCKTSLDETPVFQDLSTTSKTDVLSRLFIGAPGIPANSEPDTSNPGFVAHKVHGVLDEHTVLEVNDDKGRTFFLKNVLSTVTLEGWTQLPTIYEVDEISSNSSVVYKSDTSASNGDIVDFLDDDQAFVEWDSVFVEADGLYDISFRYSMGTETRTMQLLVNEEEIFLDHAGRPLVPINHIANEPPPESMPLSKCQGDCDRDDECGDGLFCLKMDGNEGYFPGCSGLPSGSGQDYCVDPRDSALPIFLPTGSYNLDWRHWSTRVYMNAGLNTIRLKVAHKGQSAPNIDYLKVEGLNAPTAASFRNPPHFVSHIVNKDTLGEKNVRDAMYETDAVLDHYLFHDNTAPFLCNRIMQRFGLSNPSPRYVKECTKAFRTGKYAVSDEVSFGSEEYGSLEATIAAVLLDKEATDESISQDMSYGSLREPILKVMHLLRSQNYEAMIPVSPIGLPAARDYHLRLWRMNLKIGQSPYEFPTVFSWFLPEYVADVGPTLDAKLVSPEALVSTMPNTLGILNGMFSLIKYGLNDCFQGFSTDPSIGISCASQSSPNSESVRYSNSYGRLAFEPSGSTTAEYLGELATLLTAGRLSDANRAEILSACDSQDKASAVRCIQQLLVTTGEFHSTNTQIPTSETRTKEEVRIESDEPYKAIVYVYFAGGCDSYSMLTPHTCTRNPNYDVYDRYRTIRGKSDLSEGVGLPRSELLEIDANNPAQPCETFGIHNNLTVLEELYNTGELTFVANAGLLSRPVNTSNYRKEMPTQLFAHNAMTKETKSEDLFDVFAGSGVGGRLADVLTAKGIPTNTFSIDGQQVLLTGVQGGSGPSPVVLSSGGLPAFNQYPELPNMNQVILNLNNATSPDSGFFAETWSHGLADSLATQAILKDAIDAATIKSDISAEDLNNGFLRELIMCTRIMQTREIRGSKRDICYVSDGGYDMHSDVLASLVNRFTTVNFALGKFVQEVKALDLWKNVTVVQFSEFGRTLDPNSGDGVDHAWGGNHFVFGGSIDGGKIRGLYPHDFVQSSTNPIALSRGRMIPTTPWDASWAGVAEWFGADKGAEMEKVLPMHSNFGPSVIFDEANLYKSEQDVAEAPASIAPDDSPVTAELTVSTDVSPLDDDGEFNHLEDASDADNENKLLGIATKQASFPTDLSLQNDEGESNHLEDASDADNDNKLLGKPGLVVDYQSRCGKSELHAREECGKVCETNSDCGDGKYCWGVHANYCGSIPKRTYTNPVQSDLWHRCGTDEIRARTFCGAPCSWIEPCLVPGETCQSTRSNFCGSDYTEGTVNLFGHGEATS